MNEAAGRGEHSAVYPLEEIEETLFEPVLSYQYSRWGHARGGTLGLFQVEPLRFSPDEFASLVRSEVEEREDKIVMIDSTAGYSLSMRGRDLVRNVQALSMYLKGQGVTVFLIDEVESITGKFQATANHVG